MERPVLRIIAARRSSDRAVPSRVIATVFAPKDTGKGDFGCLVSVPGVLDGDKLILGVDEDHAAEVSAYFVCSLLRGMQIDICQEETVESDT